MVPLCVWTVSLRGWIDGLCGWMVNQIDGSGVESTFILPVWIDSVDVLDGFIVCTGWSRCVYGRSRCVTG